MTHDTDPRRSLQRVRALLALMTCCCWVIACTGTEVGNPTDRDAPADSSPPADIPTDSDDDDDGGTSTTPPDGDTSDDDFAPLDSDAQLALRGYDGEQEGALLLTSGDTVDEAWLLVASAQLIDCNGAAASDRFGPFAVELVSGQALPALPTWTLAPQTLCAVELGLAALAPALVPAGSPADLGSATLLLKGRRQSGLPFVVVAEVESSVSLASQGAGFSLEGGPQGLIVGVALDVVLGEPTLLGLLPGLDGVIRLTRALTPLQLDALTQTLTDSSRLFRDVARNADLDPEDFAQPLGQASP